MPRRFFRGLRVQGIGYDGMNRLVSEQNLGTGSALPYANQFTAAPAGNRSEFSDSARATPAPFPEVPGFSEGLSYGGVGSRLSKDSTLSDLRTYSYDDDNRIIPVRRLFPWGAITLLGLLTAARGAGGEEEIFPEQLLPAEYVQRGISALRNDPPGAFALDGLGVDADRLHRI